MFNLSLHDWSYTEHLQKVVDSTDPLNIYVWYAEVWHASSAAKWQIKNIIDNWAGIITTKFPKNTEWNPDNGFNFIWDNRAALIYSFNA